MVNPCVHSSPETLRIRPAPRSWPDLADQRLGRERLQNLPEAKKSPRIYADFPDRKNRLVP